MSCQQKKYPRIKQNIDKIESTSVYLIKKTKFYFDQIFFYSAYLYFLVQIERPLNSGSFNPLNSFVLQNVYYFEIITFQNKIYREQVDKSELVKN